MHIAGSSKWCQKDVGGTMGNREISKALTKILNVGAVTCPGVSIFLTLPHMSMSVAVVTSRWVSSLVLRDSLHALKRHH